MSGAGIGIAQGDVKFRELILYICSRSEWDRKFGAIKLNKLLFYADLYAHLYLGQSITGQPYQKLKLGPAPRYLVPVRDEMIQDGELTEESLRTGTRSRRRAIAMREADLDKFSAPEIDIVNRVLDRFQNTSGTDLSELSHEFIGWSVADYNEDINFNAAFVSARPLTAKEREMAKQYLDNAEKCLDGDTLRHVSK